MVQNKKIPKGQKGYLAQHKKVMILRTVLLFSLSAAVFLLGYFSTKSRENLLTIVAVVGCLPACRSAVSMIMVLRYHGISDGHYREIQPHEKGLTCLSDLVFTSYEKNYEIHHMAYANGHLIGFTANASCDAKACEKHLHGLCVQNSLGKVDIKIFQDLPKYEKRMDQLSEMAASIPDAEKEAEADMAARVCALMKAISL